MGRPPYDRMAGRTRAVRQHALTTARRTGENRTGKLWPSAVNGGVFPALYGAPSAKFSGKRNGGFWIRPTESSRVAVRAIAVAEADTTTAQQDAADYVLLGMRAITLISKSKPASQLTPIAVQFG